MRVCGYVREKYEISQRCRKGVTSIRMVAALVKAFLIISLEIHGISVVQFSPDNRESSTSNTHTWTRCVR